MRLIDLTGREFGRLVVEGQAPKTHQEIYWQCRCVCGGSVSVAGHRLRNGTTRSCGCLLRDMLIERNTSHNQTHTRLYGVWNSMIMRCTNPNTEKWPTYGGRGINVCERWRLFDNFLADMGQPGAGESLDRIDVDGDYAPGNCRWATARMQQNNRRDNRMLTAFGRTQSLQTWSRELGIARETLRYHVNKGRTLEQVCTKRGIACPSSAISQAG